MAHCQLIATAIGTLILSKPNKLICSRITARDVIAIIATWLNGVPITWLVINKINAPEE